LHALQSTTIHLLPSNFLALNLISFRLVSYNLIEVERQWNLCRLTDFDCNSFLKFLHWGKASDPNTEMTVPEDKHGGSHNRIGRMGIGAVEN
jgi:hypothetical protein